mgnify:FL=1
MQSTIINRDPSTARMPSLRMPTMGVYVPNMYLAPTGTTTTNGNLSTNENQHILVCERGIFTCLMIFFIVDFQINRHTIRESRRFANHPVLPHYLAGCHDGSVYLLNWSQDSSPRQVREASKRVTKIELTNEGNKVIISNRNNKFILNFI